MSDAHAPTPEAAPEEYVVVARRYRPQTFDELIGQGHVAQALKHAISAGRVGHAYLFTGARGVGKTSAARILAKALNCERGPSPTPCNACDICRSVSTGDDVDVLEIDGASNRGIDEIRQLRQNVAIRPSRARFKVYIIDEVHMLTKEAFNALLKTLEEPPEHVKFIFATTEPNKIPVTILSRCQRFDFAGIESESIQTRLAQIAEAEGVSIEREALQVIAQRAAGSMRDSQSLLEQLLAVAEGAVSAHDVNELLGVAPAKRIGDLARKLSQRDALGALAELDGAIAGGADVGQLLDQLVGYFRDVMAAAVGAPPERSLYALPTQADEVSSLAGSLGVHTLLAILQVLDEAAARMRVSVHGRTITEMAIVRVCCLDDLDDLASLVAGLREDAPAASPSASSGPQAPPTRENPHPAPAAGASSERDKGAHPPSPKADRTGPSGPSTSDASPLSDEEAQRLWTAATAHVGGLLGQTAALASSVGGSGVDGVLVRFDAAVHCDMCDQPAHKSALEAALSDCAGRTLRVDFEASGAGAGAGGEAPRRRSRRQVLAEVAQQPLIQSAMELFDVPPDRIRYNPPPGAP